MPNLSPRSRKTLLRIARESIASAFSPAHRGPETATDDPELAAEAGAFVTLHKRGHLRGCIGTFQPRGLLSRTVAEMARAAAFEDSRFPPLAADELSQIDLEISVLTPMRRIKDPGEVEVGRHGLWVAEGYNRGVLLPQVATEHGWDRDTFLAQTCRKAGLPPDAWRRGAEVFVFEADVFGEVGQA